MTDAVYQQVINAGSLYSVYYTVSRCQVQFTRACGRFSIPVQVYCTTVPLYDRDTFTGVRCSVPVQVAGTVHMCKCTVSLDDRDTFTGVRCSVPEQGCRG